MISQRPFADSRPTAFFVFSSLRLGAGRLTQMWLARLRGFDASGWATHAVLVNRDARLDATVARLVADGQLPAATSVHHYAMRDRLVRPSWRAPVPAGVEIDPRVADWLDWLTGRVPGAVVVADSPATYPYVAQMSNPAVARLAGVHLNHLAGGPLSGDPATAPLAARFATRFDAFHSGFDAVVVTTDAQARDLTARYGEGVPVVAIPPALLPPGGASPDVSGPQEAGPPGADPRVVSVGPLEEWMRHADAIRAIAHLPVPAQLDIVGEGALADDLQRLAADLGVAERVRITPPADPDEPFRRAAVTVWTGRREASPLAIVRSLAHGVPVVARDVRYGPRELVGGPELGDLFTDQAGLEHGLARWLATPADPVGVQAAAHDVLAGCAPDAVAGRWVDLATELAAAAVGPTTLLVEEMRTTTKAPRLRGVLATSGTGPLTEWTFELPGLQNPAGLIHERTRSADPEEGDVPVPADGPTKEVSVELRTSALAYVATQADPYRVEFSDGTTTVPLLAPAFEDRIIASQAGTATLARHSDGSVWVSALPELIEAENVDGRVFVRMRPGSSPSDVTHAVDWSLEVDWSTLVARDTGAEFSGTLRARGIVPAEGSTPSICIRDVGGLSRAVGTLARSAPPEVDGRAWSVEVRGALDGPALAATTELSRGVLALFLGYRAETSTLGVLWTRGRGSRLLLASPRGEATLLPSAGGRVLAAPGKGRRARALTALRGALRRG